MTQLKRWLDEGAPDHVRELLAAGARSRPLSDAVRARSARRVAAIAAVPVGFAALITSSGTVLAAAAGVSIGVAVAVGGPALLAEKPAPREEPAVMPGVSRPPRARPPARPRPAAPAPQPAPREAHSVAAPPPPRSAADSLLEETQLLEQARTLLGSNPSGALGFLDEHARRFPHGKLAIERQLLAIDALGRSGRTAEAAARAAKLRSKLAGTIYEPRLKQLMNE